MNKGCAVNPKSAINSGLFSTRPPGLMLMQNFSIKNCTVLVWSKTTTLFEPNILPASKAADLDPILYKEMDPISSS